MKIEELLSEKNDDEKIDIEGICIPVSALKKLMRDGYAHLNPFSENKTINAWGKNVTACFTEKQLQEMR
ncbi:MAG: hypothetical protein DRG35_06480 [Deltaproteobacteria bacterium]|nr:MAG: hypothetical protein DRG35_06480 [Deltaproteobacteria bacterium]HDH87798.1 hypothetical protein [Desulfobacteraceae bacterium]